MTKHESEQLLDSLIHGKLPRNLSWDDVLELIKHLGHVEPHGEEFAFTVGEQRDFFRKPHGHDLDVREASLLRNFLHRATQPGGMSAPATGRIVVVIDHHGAQVYREDGRSVPTREDSERPYDPHSFHRHLIHRKEAHYKGERTPEEDSFYEAVAHEIQSAAEVILIGHATGTSSAVDVLLHFLEDRHSDIAQRVAMVDKVDLSALTQPEVEELAKAHLVIQVEKPV